MLEINLKNLKRNVAKILEYQRGLIAVVKNNAYGCGVEVVCRTLVEECGVRYLFVNDVREAREVLALGLDASVLIGNSVASVGDWVSEKVIFSINCLEDAKYLVSQNLTNRVHIQVDTGMNRLGMKSFDELKQTIELVQNSTLVLDGLYTHFSSVETSAASLEFFRNATRLSDFRMIHCCASSTYRALDFGTHFRIGLDLYDLHQVMEVKVRPIAIRHILAKETVGYLESFRAEKDIRIAVLPVGYGNGYRLAMEGFEVLANGVRYPLVGRVCMNHIFVEVDENVTLDTVFTLTSEELRASELAAHLKTHSYEVYTGFHFSESRVIK